MILDHLDGFVVPMFLVKQDRRVGDCAVDSADGRRNDDPLDLVARVSMINDFPLSVLARLSTHPNFLALSRMPTVP